MTIIGGTLSRIKPFDVIAVGKAETDKENAKAKMQNKIEEIKRKLEMYEELALNLASEFSKALENV